MRLIRRYSNRKMYDTSDSRYVTLNDVAALVRRGENLRVVEHPTERDITAVVFAQILFEEEKVGPRLSANELVRIIRQGLREDQQRQEDRPDRPDRGGGGEDRDD